jgi:hypothetical protein
MVAFDRVRGQGLPQRTSASAWSRSWLTYIEAQQRLGAGWAEVEPPAVTEVDGQPVEPVGGNAGALPCGLYRIEGAGTSSTLVLISPLATYRT